MAMIPRARLNRRVRFEAKARPGGRGKAGQETWTPVAILWAELQDALPSRGERLAEGLTIATRPSRLRLDYRAGLTSDMRVLLLRKDGADYVVDRTMAIVAGPAELGERDAIEFMVADYSTSGTGA
ncbi:head-tail adaptor protein [Sphingomonas naphthae]|uniref:Head-tail adaptor protein n=1 Tax=Sphingomonas naphthae TaxID=1813468 RepID=A0ABY7TP64_9SPHN|nr:head-tail adaptor protein [Sphingomonas naphthae]WCT75032.1 head-tail adaptor protein [Sphingomonas naphthae]